MIALAAMIYKKSAVQHFERHPCLYILTFSFVSANITNKLVVAHMTKSEMYLYDTAFISPALLFLDQHFNSFIDEYIVLWFALIPSLFDLLRYCVSVCNQNCCPPAHPRIPHQGLPHALEPSLGMGAATGEWRRNSVSTRMDKDFPFPGYKPEQHVGYVSWLEDWEGAPDPGWGRNTEERLNKALIYLRIKCKTSFAIDRDLLSLKKKVHSHSWVFGTLRKNPPNCGLSFKLARAEMEPGLRERETSHIRAWIERCRATEEMRSSWFAS
ncbi:hypothetical protein DUI87_03286 [Hirundo rustica rustica]|uniref:Uncharacterized protein n=1 Tax=Hirundo rustica rustica TaxID=333673 RepID=A0A3M0L2D1_HIRRU|nr:hypothetical protein DUI87_03286 [Hirundo rustica rustica]